jgi:hypothetical protein
MLLVAFALCLIVTVFSWPDAQDRKRALGPKLAGCCEIRIGPHVLVERSVRPSRQGAPHTLAQAAP